MIKNTFLDLLFIRASIFSLRSIAPLSIFYTGIRALGYSFIPLPLEIAAFIESFFYFFVSLPLQLHYDNSKAIAKPRSREDRRALFERSWNSLTDHDAFVSTWFKGASHQDLRRSDLKDFFAWVFLNKSAAMPEDDEELEEYIQKSEQRLGVSFKPGRSKFKPVRSSIDPLNIHHKSFFFYLYGVGGIDVYTTLRMYRHGFQHYRLPISRFLTVFPPRGLMLLSPHVSPAPDIPYWYRPHRSTTRPPILFVHGVGVGLHVYTSFLGALSSHLSSQAQSPCDQVGIIALEMHSVSMRITPPTLAPSAMVAQIHGILREHGWGTTESQRLILVAHSYGTVIATHLMHDPRTRQLIGPVCLLDPVALSFHMGDIAYNFLYRKPRLASEHQLSYFACRDLGIAFALTRRFDWAENMLWREDLRGRRVTVLLCGGDIIVDTRRVGEYLAEDRELWSRDEGDEESGWRDRPWKGKGLDVLWYEGLNHAEVFESRRDMEPLIGAIGCYAANSAAV